MWDSVVAYFLSIVTRYSHSDADIAFFEYSSTFGKEYGTDEWELRRATFFENLRYTTEFNSDPSNKVWLHTGPFADLREDEFKSFVSRGEGDDITAKSPWGELGHLGTFTHDVEIPAPESSNWLQDGGVTAVRNQGTCGSCWSFSTTGALEGRYFATYGKLVNLSEQNLLDCDDQAYRCQGGFMRSAFTYVQRNGLCTDISYPYACFNAKSEACKSSKCHSDCTLAINPGMLVGYKDIARDTHSLMQAVADGPVSVAIQADSKVFQFYSKGVLTSELCGTTLDHAVLCVGYGVEAGTEYWLVKNSWGPNWGENGYIRIGRGYPPENAGQCGILKRASFPIFILTDQNEIVA